MTAVYKVKQVTQELDLLFTHVGGAQVEHTAQDTVELEAEV